MSKNIDGNNNVKSLIFRQRLIKAVYGGFLFGVFFLIINSNNVSYGQALNDSQRKDAATAINNISSAIRFVNNVLKAPNGIKARSALNKLKMSTQLIYKIVMDLKGRNLTPTSLNYLFHALQNLFYSINSASNKEINSYSGRISPETLNVLRYYRDNLIGHQKALRNYLKN